MNTPKPKTITAWVIRTAMCGGGTSYRVYFRTKDKPSHSLHGGHYYATTICTEGQDFFAPLDAIDPRSHWEMECGFPKYEAMKRLEKIAGRLALRIAKRAFPELAPLRRLPDLWADWNKPSAVVQVRVRMTLPE